MSTAVRQMESYIEAGCQRKYNDIFLLTLPSFRPHKICSRHSAHIRPAGKPYMDRITYISVILPLKLEWEPCYRTDIEDIRPGQRVKVLFAGKEYIGAVSAVGIEPQVAPARIMQIISREEKLDDILPEEIRFWRALAEYYMCTVGEVYRTAYPGGKIFSEEIRARKNEALLARQERLKEIQARKEEAARARAEKAMARLSEKRCRLRETLERKKQMLEKCRDTGRREKILSWIDSLEEQIRNVETVLQKASEDAMSGGTAAASDSLPAGTLPHEDTAEVSGTGIVLSGPQRDAENEIRDAFRQGKTVLLNGVTGSGKTEIYISLASETLKKGMDVLYLVPEKAMGRQLEERLRGYFGEGLLLFHSGVGASRKTEVADRIRSAGRQSCIVLGTRSAIFLPHRSLGLVIVDEEHDTSYKQDSPAPRYNGRDAAIMLASVQGKGCNVIIGSATPSLESIYNCSSGKFREVRLDSRYYGGTGAEVMIIDTVAERRKKGMVGTFSRKLIDSIQSALVRGGQVMLLRTRRGYSPVLQCSECGYIPKCPKCNVSLTYHKDSGRIICHHCGYRTLRPDKCPECGGSLTGLGTGTQKIEEEAAALFPAARIARLDSDTAQRAGFEAGTIKAFSKGEIDILIGTQIVAKGFDFGRLSLVAVLQADTLLGVQDFRADEKAFQILEQFKGRSGRRGDRGTFIIQTAQPDHPVYRALQENSEAPEQEFCSGLLAEREEFGYPPYTRIIDITLKDRIEDRAARMADALTDCLYGFNVTGPYVPSTGRSAEGYIRAVRISLPKDRTLADRKRLLLKSLDAFETRQRYTGHITVNVDPA